MSRNPKNAQSLPMMLALLLVSVASVARSGAEEITLIDGQKMTGVIVGFDDGMFKVETEFGFALVRKDKVKSITFTPGTVHRGEAPKAVVPAALPAPAPTVPSPPAQLKVPPAPVAAEAKPAPALRPPPPPPPPPVSRPIDQPLPKEIVGRVDGTTYVNETFQFSFYKPPGWKIHEDAPRETGRAIVAVGTADEQTVLFVDRQVWSGEPDLKSDATEANLRATYQKYRKTLETASQLGGRPAVRKEFEGELDGALWRGVAVRVAQGKMVFGVIGLTSAETLQFHEAVINKIINSFHFLSSASPTPASR